MSQNNEEVSKNIANDSVKELANALKKLTISSEELNVEPEANKNEGSEFKVVKSNLPAKVNFWTKVRNVMFYEIKVELTPRQQKIEDDINNFLHKEITWNSFKNFWLQEVPITYKGKRVF